MANVKVFVFSNGEYDRARWLTVSHRGNGSCVLSLTDLCQPGMVSSLCSIACPLEYVKATLVRGAYQVTTSIGYLLLRRSGPLISLEFKGFEDRSGVKATFLSTEFLEIIEAVQAEADCLSVR